MELEEKSAVSLYLAQYKLIYRASNVVIQQHFGIVVRKMAQDVLHKFKFKIDCQRDGRYIRSKRTIWKFFPVRDVLITPSKLPRK